MYDFDSNAILAEPIKSHHIDDLISGYEACYKELNDARIQPIYQCLYNKKSDDFLAAIKKKQLKYQRGTANDHHTNPAKRGIRTFKEHFIAILNGTDRRFPAGLWHKLLPQTITTLNLLRKSRINPKLSAYHQVFGKFDFNQIPLAPLG